MQFLKPALALLLTCSFASAAGPQSLGQVRRIYVARMPNNLDQYVRTEIYKQFKDKVSVVLDRREADGVLVEPGVGGGRAFPLPAMNSAEPRPGNEILISLLDRSGKVMLWSDDVGSRDEMYKRGGVHTVAEHIVHRLKKAIESSK
jgi:hypothetical protein